MHAAMSGVGKGIGDSAFARRKGQGARRLVVLVGELCWLAACSDSPQNMTQPGMMVMASGMEAQGTADTKQTTPASNAPAPAARPAATNNNAAVTSAAQATMPASPTAAMPAQPAAGMPAMASTATAANIAGAGGQMAAGGPGIPSTTEGGMPGCLEGITDFANKGPFEVEQLTEGAVYLWVPKVPSGCKVPVTQLAVGTGSSCGSGSYLEINAHLASHGFFATCYDNPNTGAGTLGIMAIEAAYNKYPDLAGQMIGSLGHSQGGQASFIVLQFAEEKWGDSYKYAGLAMEPASGFGAQPSGGTWAQIYAKIKSPMFMFNGTADTLVAGTWVGQAYAAMGDTEVYWWAANGATHVPAPSEHTRQVAVPWFRWKLLGDVMACKAFKALPDTDQWDVMMQKNEASCE